MALLSQTAEYALRAVLFLAARGEPATAAEIGAAIGMPANYLSKTLNTLVRAGVLASQRGRTGGFRLAVPARTLSLARVVAPFDGMGRRACLLGRSECSDRHPCAVHDAWKTTADRVAVFFRTTMVGDLGGAVGQLTVPSAAP